MTEQATNQSGIRPYDAANYLNTAEDAAEYLKATLEDGDIAEFRAALGVVARSRSMAAIARAAGMGRESLYKALRPEGNPGLDTIARVMDALGLRLSAVAAPKPADAPEVADA